MQTGLIIAALRKHRLATLLIAMEIALACAVLCCAMPSSCSRRRGVH
jgi:putative ABC transport system permease protein